MKWGLEECTYRDNAVEGEVNDYRITRGCVRSVYTAPCQFTAVMLVTSIVSRVDITYGIDGHFK